MPTYSGIRVKCPYYDREADKSITCTGVGQISTFQSGFVSKEKKRDFKCTVCETKNYEKICKVAQLLTQFYEKEEAP